MKNNIFGERLSEERKNIELNQTELGRRLNMSQRKISRIETGAAEPTPDDIVAICELLDTSADYLLGITNEYNKKPKLGRKKNTKNKKKNIAIYIEPTEITNKITLAKQTILLDYHIDTEDLKQEYWVSDDIINQILENNINQDTYNIIKILNAYTARNGKTLLENLTEQMKEVEQ